MKEVIDCQLELKGLKEEFESFTYIISHDMKASLRAVSNLTSWIEEDLGEDVDPDVLQNFNLLKNRVDRLQNMLSALLELSRVNTAEWEVYEVNIPKMMENCVAMVENNKGVKIHTKLNLINDNCNTVGDKLQKVMTCLLDNAVRFHDKNNGNVFLDISENDKTYEIQVADDGPGVSEESREKIFSIFYTAHSKDIIDSTGASLAICKKILKRLGGSLKYFPNKDNGSVFSVSWPKEITLIN